MGSFIKQNDSLQFNHFNTLAAIALFNFEYVNTGRQVFTKPVELFDIAICLQHLPAENICYGVAECFCTAAQQYNCKLLLTRVWINIYLEE